MIKRLVYDFPEELKEVYQDIYYNEFAVFLIKEIEKKEELFMKYKECESFIAAYIQNNPALLNEYFADREVIWDIYLFLIIDFTIEPEERIRIENDRFYCKKNIINRKPGLKAEDYIQYSTLFTTFQGKNCNDNFISTTYFEKELLSGLDFAELTELFIKEDFISLATENIEEIIDSWVTGVDKDV